MIVVSGHDLFQLLLHLLKNEGVYLLLWWIAFFLLRQTTINEKNDLIELVKKEVKKWRTQNDQNLKYEREPAAMPHHKKKQKTGSSFSPNASELNWSRYIWMF